MRTFSVGLAVGLVLGITLTALAGIPSVTGSNGNLNGWSVIVKHRIACKNPFVRVKEREIECLK